MMFFTGPRFGFVVLILAVCLPEGARAAACCGGGGTSVGVLGGDEQSALRVAVRRSTVIGEARGTAKPQFWSDQQQNILNIFELSGATLLSDRWQLAAAMPIQLRQVQESAASGQFRDVRLGDVATGLYYEMIPEWSYSAWRPKGFVGVQLEVPTGRSMFVSQRPGMSDVSGSGFYKISLVALFLKQFSVVGAAWDASVLLRGSRSLGREFELFDGSRLAADGAWGFIPSVGVGVTPRHWPWSVLDDKVRFGAQLSIGWLQPRSWRLTGGELGQESVNQNLLSGKVARTQVVNTTTEVAFSVSAEWTLSGSYTDQTLLGPARNVALNRMFALELSRYWMR